jgi:predicted nucleic acid-binding protein
MPPDAEMAEPTRLLHGLRTGPSTPTLVLDTNVVLDWLYFRDPRCARLAALLEGGAARWIASPSMGAELRHVLVRDIGRRGAGAVDATLSGWERWARIVEPHDAAVPLALRCSDAADQKFIDLAWRSGASALLSADRAVLRLARRAAGHGLAICRLEDWTPGPTPAN